MTRPEAEWSELCRFLDLSYDDAMVRFHEGRTRHEPGLTPKQAWLPITPNLRNWREQMPAADIERFEAAAGDLLHELGYERRFPQPSGALHGARNGDPRADHGRAAGEEAARACRLVGRLTASLRGRDSRDRA